MVVTHLETAYPALASLDFSDMELPGQYQQMEYNPESVVYVERLAADVVHRELYRDKGGRQKLAIDAVQAGETLEGLMENHGLSSDEAELLLALHGNTERSDEFRPAA